MLNNFTTNKKIFDEALKDVNVSKFLQYKKEKINKNEELYSQAKKLLLDGDGLKIIQKIKEDKYDIKPPVLRLLKKRYKATYRQVFDYGNDRIILSYLNYLLINIYDQIFVDNVYSFRPNKTTADFLIELKNLDHGKLYSYKTDISSFGESIDTNIMKNKLSILLNKDKDFYNFCVKLIDDKKYYRNNELYEDWNGLKTGLPLTNFFENIYLTDIDEACSKSKCIYSRFGDDIIILSYEKKNIMDLSRNITQTLKDLHLEQNESKTYFRAPGERIEILGLELYNGNIDLSKHTISKNINILKKIANRLVIECRLKKIDKNDAVQAFMNFVNSKYFGFGRKQHELNWSAWAFPVITSIEGIKKIDKAIQNCIRYILSGKKTDSRYRIKYKDIKNIGYVPLVRYYYKYYGKK